MTNSQLPPLKPRQEEIFRFVARTVKEQGFPPTMREISEACKLSSLSSVTYQLSSLEKKGYIRRQSGKSRSIEILAEIDAEQQASSVHKATKNHGTKTASKVSKSVAAQAAEFISARQTASVPLVGRIAAGIPITAQEQVEDVFALPTALVGDGEIFMLKVVGDSMIDAAICDGDYVVIRQQHDANNGDIVAAMLDGEATVKTFKRRDGHIWLLPQNTEFAPILGDECTVLGKVVAVLRSV